MLPYNHLFLIHNEFIYTRLQSLIWAGDGLLFNSKFNAGANQIFLEIANNIHPNLPLIVNCKRVTNFDESVYRLIKANNLRRKIIFTNVEESFHAQFANELEAIFNGLSQQNKSKKLISTNHTSYNFSLQQYDEICQKVLNLISSKNKEIVSSCFKYNNEGDHNQLEPLPSTAILATGEFDAGQILSKPEHFILLSLSLSDLVEDYVREINIKYHDDIKCRLISVSLRGSPFAAAISLLSSPEIKYDTVDHLGPKHKLFDIDFFDKQKLNINEQIRYIYFGDFIVGGTELKIAQTYSQIYGYELAHAVVIGSFFEAERYLPSVELKSLVKLKELNIPHLKFVLEP